jgi:hypothetical protein
MISKRIYDVLYAKTEVNNVVSERIFLLEAPQDTIMPFVTYEFEDRNPIKTLQGESNLKDETWVIKLNGKSYVALDALKELVLITLSEETETFRSSLQDIEISKDTDADTYQFNLFLKFFYY